MKVIIAIHLKFTHLKRKLHHPGGIELTSPAPWIPGESVFNASNNRLFMCNDLTGYDSMHNTTQVMFPLPNLLQNVFSFPTDLHSLQMCTTMQVGVFKSLHEQCRIIASQISRDKCQHNVNQNINIDIQGNALWNCCVQKAVIFLV